MRQLIAAPHLRVTAILTTVILPLAAAAAGAGLFQPGLYRETDWVVPQIRGQDLVTLLILPVTAAALLAARRGSARGSLIWIGLLGYLFYTYTGAAFAYALNEFFLIYVALFSLSVFALVSAATGIDVNELERRFEAAPHRAVAVFLLLLALMLSALWLGQIVPFLVHGAVPESITLAGEPAKFVYVLDLGLIVPLALLAAFWLWRRFNWGYVLAGFLLIKGATLGLALLSMTWFAMHGGQPVEMGLAAAWVVITAGSLGMSIWFFQRCRG